MDKKQQVISHRENIRRQLKSLIAVGPLQKKKSQEKQKSTSSPVNLDDVLNMKCQTEDTFDQLFETCEKIGEGAQSVVKRVVERATKKEFAVKIMRNVDAETIMKIKHQYKILKTLDLPTIIKAHWLFINDKERTCKLVLELCQWDDLRQQLTDFQRMSEEFTAELIKALLETIDYLHSKGICHRDIKPENILYSPFHSPSIKLIDFGISTYQHKHKNQMWTATTGTIFYKAPQMFEGAYSDKVDVWATGILAYQLLHGQTPFAKQFLDETIDEIRQTPIKNYLKEGLESFTQDFLKRLLAKNQNERPTAKEALKLPFILRTSTKPITPKIEGLNNSFDNDDQFLQQQDDIIQQSPMGKIKNMQQARKWSGSNLLDHEFGVKYENTKFKGHF